MNRMTAVTTAAAICLLSMTACSQNQAVSAVQVMNGCWDSLSDNVYYNANKDHEFTVLYQTDSDVVAAEDELECAFQELRFDDSTYETDVLKLDRIKIDSDIATVEISVPVNSDSARQHGRIVKFELKDQNHGMASVQKMSCLRNASRI